MALLFSAFAQLRFVDNNSHRRVQVIGAIIAARNRACVAGGIPSTVRIRCFASADGTDWLRVFPVFRKRGYDFEILVAGSGLTPSDLVPFSLHRNRVRPGAGPGWNCFLSQDEDSAQKLHGVLHTNPLQ